MSNILIIFHAPILDNNHNNIICFYDSLAGDLRENGNNVLLINTIIFKNYYSSSFNDENKSPHVLGKIKEFNPDLVISFNHQIFEEIPKMFDCPIVIWDADCYDRFSNKQLFVENKDRYHVFTLSKGWIKDYTDVGLDKNRIFHMPAATSVKSEDLVQDKNISFIGSKFNAPHYMKKWCENLTSLKKLQHAWSDFVNHDSYDYNSILVKHKLYLDYENNLSDILFDTRIVVLTSLIDLGLELYGPQWDECVNTFPQLAFCYNKDPLFSLKHNQDLYNSSKICLNINHPQTRGYCFSWRVFDIMASNGCLVSSHASELQEMTKNYVEIPTYNSPYDARELCKSILKDDVRRNEIVKASQKFIEENALWEHRFKDIEQITGVKLLNDREKKGDLSILKNPFPTIKKPAESNGPGMPVEHRHKIMGFELNALKKYRLSIEFTKKRRKNE